MQISRHWRLNSQRYRLEGYRYDNGRLSLQARPNIQPQAQLKTVEAAEKPAQKVSTAAVA